MSSYGVNNETGQILEGWPHVQQSIAVILTTPIGTRIMRRDFGSEVPALIDRPMTYQNILAIYAATANALTPRQVADYWYGEPRFRLRQCNLIEADESGSISLDIGGDYLPLGHLGDETVEESVQFAVALR